MSTTLPFFLGDNLIVASGGVLCLFVANYLSFEIKLFEYIMGERRPWKVLG